MISACALALLSTSPRSTRSVSTRERLMMDSLAISSCRWLGSVHQRLEIVYGPLKTLAQGNGRLPTQQFTRLRDIRAALQGIILRQRHLDDFRLRSDHFNHDLGQLTDRELAGIS